MERQGEGDFQQNENDAPLADVFQHEPDHADEPVRGRVDPTPSGSVFRVFAAPDGSDAPVVASAFAALHGIFDKVDSLEEFVRYTVAETQAANGGEARENAGGVGGGAAGDGLDYPHALDAQGYDSLSGSLRKFESSLRPLLGAFRTGQLLPHDLSSTTRRELEELALLITDASGSGVAVGGGGKGCQKADTGTTQQCTSRRQEIHQQAARLFAPRFDVAFDAECQSTPYAVTRALKLVDADDLDMDEGCPNVEKFPTLATATLVDGILTVPPGSGATHWQPLLPLDYVAITEWQKRHSVHELFFPPKLLRQLWFEIGPGMVVDVRATLQSLYGTSQPQQPQQRQQHSSSSSSSGYFWNATAFEGFLRRAERQTGDVVEGLRLGNSESIRGGRQLDVVAGLVPMNKPAARANASPSQHEQPAKPKVASIFGAFDDDLLG